MVNPQIYHFFAVISFIILCSLFTAVSIISSLERFTEGTVSLAKFFKMAALFSAKSELRVNSADFEVGENDRIIS